MKYNSGFGLIEVLIILGVIVTGVMGLTSLSTYSNRQTSKLNLLNEMQTVVDTIYGVLAEPQACTWILENKILNPTGAFPQPASFGVGDQKVGTGSIWNSKLKFTKADWIAVGNQLNSGSPRVFPTTLQISAAPANSSFGSNDWTKTIELIISIDDSNKIKRCYSTIDGKDYCNRMNGSFVPEGFCKKSRDPKMFTSAQFDAIAVGKSTPNPLSHLFPWLPPIGTSTTYPCSKSGEVAYVEGKGVTVCVNGKYDTLAREKSAARCRARGGEPINDVCRFNQSECPAGLSQVGNWSTTQAATCSGGSTTNWVLCIKRVDERFCTTGAHGWSNRVREHCEAWKKAACGGLDDYLQPPTRCDAIRTQIGCQFPSF